MKIYVIHSRNFDYKKELYEPIRNSEIEHDFILPHEDSDKPFNSKDFLRDKCDLVIAEVSYCSIGLGIELGWANVFEVPILCVSRKGSKLSGSLKVLTKDFIEYSDSEELIVKLKKFLS